MLFFGKAETESEIEQKPQTGANSKTEKPIYKMAETAKPKIPTPLSSSVSSPWMNKFTDPLMTVLTKVTGRRHFNLAF